MAKKTIKSKSGVPHIIGKLSTRNKKILWTPPQSEVYTKSYGLQVAKVPISKFQDFQLGNFKTK
jgi:hypothetical protein